jgi:MarR family transcriptional regulator, transcriptional regulator for hemolysin
MTVNGDSPELAFVRECILLGRRWRARIDDVLRPTGLTLARSTVLYWLAQQPEMVTQRELADIVGIEGPTLVRQLHALEAQGLIERVGMPDDRRAKGIRLTEAAMPVVEQISAMTNEFAANALGKLEKRRIPGATRLVIEARTSLE